MSLKEQAHNNDKESEKQRSPKFTTENPDRVALQQTHPATIIQSTKLDPSSLTASNMLQLQRTIGNQAVGRLLAQRVQHQPIQKEASTDLTSAINGARGGGQPLDADLQRSMGQAMGADFSGVRADTNSESAPLNQSMQAKAFTTGQDVFFRQGAYEPGSRDGQELNAPELAYVAQQNRETRKPDIKGNELRGNTAAGPMVQRVFDFENPPTDANQFNLQFKDSLAGLSYRQKRDLFIALKNDPNKYKREKIPNQISIWKQQNMTGETKGGGEQKSEEKGKKPAVKGQDMPSMGRIENPNWEEISALLPSYGIDDEVEMEKIKNTLEKELQSGEKIRGIPDLIGRALGPDRMATAARGIREKSTAFAPDIGGSEVLEMGRGDTRSPVEINKTGGFFAWDAGIVTLEHARQLIRKVGQMTVGQQRTWVGNWKWPTPPSEERNPWIATGIGGGQLGHYKYIFKMPLKQSPGGGTVMELWTDSGALDTAKVIGVRLFLGNVNDEIILLTGIPKKYIESCNDTTLEEEQWQHWDKNMGYHWNPAKKKSSVL